MDRRRFLMCLSAACAVPASLRAVPPQIASRGCGLVRGLGSLVGGLAVALEQVRGQKEAAGPAETPAPEEAPAAAPAAEEAPAATEEAPPAAEAPAAEAAEPELEAAAEEQQPVSETDSDAEKEAQ